MRILNGEDLAGFIKERQARQVRGLIQADHTTPRLAIVQTLHTPVIDAYVRLKRAYGADIQIEVDPHVVSADQAGSLIRQLNMDDRVHGIIVQLPVSHPDLTDELVNEVAPQKDVDGLGQSPAFDPATSTAINWLLAGYNVDLRQKKIVVVGQGRLVGRPLTTMLRESGYDVDVADAATEDLGALTRTADVLVTATGQPGLITSDMIKPDSVVVDAGVATDAGKLVGDLADDVRDRSDLTITPLRGGVGPLTICSLFENVITAARQSTNT